MSISTIEYPSSDGKPMAETPLHMRVMMDLIETLIGWYADDPLVYVWGNLFIYFVPGDPSKNFSPDVMVVKGVDKNKPRDVFKVWEEGKSPCAIIEVTSRKTRAEDVKTKYLLYQDVLKVKEYFLFDPRADYLRPALKGYRLRRGVYQLIDEVDGRLPSRELGLHLERHAKELRLWDPDAAKWLPTPNEARRHAEDERHAARKGQKAEQRRREEAEAEIERLKRELEALRRERKNGSKGQ